MEMAKPKQKYLFIARGPGEAGQAVALAKYCAKKDAKILFCFAKNINRFFLQDEKNIKTFLTPKPNDLFKLVRKEKPQTILFFNSKMWANELKERPKELSAIKCFGVDSNWLFNNKKYPRYPFMDWLDKYFVLFPPTIFNLGLKEKGDNFEISKDVLRRIIPVGFVPSYRSITIPAIARIRKEFKVEKNEKFVFAYFSGYGAGHRAWALENFVKAADLLIKKGRKIKAIYVGPTKGVKDIENLKRDWLLFQDKLPSGKYFLTLAGSDLVFQHQGMVTLAQAICARVPVIANVSFLKDEALPKIHFWEVEPFQKAKTCVMRAKNDSPAKIAKSIDALLYNSKVIAKMKQAQKKVLTSGESAIYSYICKN